MKLKNLSAIIFVLGVSGLAEMARGFCLMSNTATPKVYSYNCFESNDYLEDVEAAPLNIPEIMFSNAKIKILLNRSFRRVSNGLKKLEIHFCEIGDIRDHAFEGLSKLDSLAIEDSNLHTVKGVWFKGLASLKRVSFKNNGLKCIESYFFFAVPPLDILDVSENELNCLPVVPLATSKTKMLRFRLNPLSWGCVNSLMYWLEKTGIKYDHFGRGNMDPSSELVFDCEDKLGKAHNLLSEEEIKNCAEKTMTDLLPRGENYTMEKVCQFVKDKPSPFLTCL